jgi:thymidylate synthase
MRDLVQGYSVAAIGNLYAVAGIEILIRNLAHNHQITRLVHCAVTTLDRNVPTTETLIRVWEGESIPGLDPVVQKLVTSRVGLVVVHQRNNLRKNLLGVPENESGYEYPDLSYPITENQPEVQAMVFTNGLLVRGINLNEAWFQLLSRVMDYGLAVRGGHGPIVDIGSVMSVFPMCQDIEPPMALSRATLDAYADTILDPRMAGDSYTYGSRIGDQIDRVVDILNRDPNSNRALISLWRPEDTDSENPPCLISIGCQIRGDRLHCRAVFRSHDIGSGWYPNVWALTRLSLHLANLLAHPDLRLGDLTVVSESAHIYQSALISLQATLKRDKPRSLSLDPVGDFVIRVSGDGAASIKHYSSGGDRAIGGYCNPGALLSANPTIGIEHYGYLCREFARAEIQGVTYKQDT